MLERNLLTHRLSSVRNEQRRSLASFRQASTTYLFTLSSTESTLLTAFCMFNAKRYTITRIELKSRYFMCKCKCWQQDWIVDLQILTLCIDIIPYGRYNIYALWVSTYTAAVNLCNLSPQSCLQGWLQYQRVLCFVLISVLYLIP